MRYLPAALGLAATLLASSAMAADPVAHSASATLHLTGTIASVCSVKIDGYDNKTFDALDLSAAGGAGAQTAGMLTYGCNSPYTLTVKSLNGKLVNQIALNKGAPLSDAITIPYGLGIDGATQLNAGQLADTVTSPAQIKQVTDWKTLAEYNSVPAAAIKINLTGQGGGNGVAGYYTDTLEFKITADL